MAVAGLRRDERGGDGRKEIEKKEEWEERQLQRQEQREILKNTINEDLTV